MICERWETVSKYRRYYVGGGTGERLEVWKNVCVLSIKMYKSQSITVQVQDGGGNLREVERAGKNALTPVVELESQDKSF